MDPEVSPRAFMFLRVRYSTLALVAWENDAVSGVGSPIMVDGAKRDRYKLYSFDLQMNS